jgi:hypothetical protein
MEAIGREPGNAREDPDTATKRLSGSSGAGSEDMTQVSELDLVDAYLIHCRRD